MTEQADPAVPDDLTIIGIGSSAGGLEALRELVGTLPADMPAAYVIVQHMSPHHKSLMTELVRKQAKLGVEDVTDGTVPKANTIYVTPPRTDVILQSGVLRLVEPSPEPASPKPSVNRFFDSLARDMGERAFGVILSGTGSDGAYGVQAIREAGGVTIAQDNESAKYNGMPQAAVLTGCVDLVLSPNDIGIHLEKILAKPRDFSILQGQMSDHPTSELLQVLLARTRIDFREYKQTTVTRRIERRMTALQIDTLDEYTELCRNNPHELDTLFKDLLISVTRFFRDKEEFERLEKELPRLIARRESGPLRVWVAGCATGEEAYSVAMLLAEQLDDDEMPLKRKFQIFATDIDANAIRIARAGKYSHSVLDAIPPHLAERYLMRHGQEMRVTENIRNTVLFSEHNICNDPPFQKVDLICCRNLMIYFGTPLQKRLMERLHYALNDEGLLFLGTAESVVGSEPLFVQTKAGGQIFAKQRIGSPGPRKHAIPFLSSDASSTGSASRTASPSPSTDKQLFDALVSSLGANSMLVSEDYSITRVHGNVTPYIEMRDTSNLRMHLDLLRSPLREEVRSLINMALRNNSHRTGVRHLLAESDSEGVRLDVYPIHAKEINERLALVVFSAVTVETKTGMGELSDGAELEERESSQRIRTLETEVANARDALQQTIEELETTNEELQSLNQELQSTNEELQAANEELETSNEELQSTNEELITVNEELQVTTSELLERSGELSSVLESAPLAILVLDTALQITQATTYAVDLFGLTSPSRNPHVSQCALPAGYPALAPLCSEALRLGEERSHEFTSDGNQVRLNCAPFFDPNGKILGITLLVSQFPGLADQMELLLNASRIFFMNHHQDGEIVEISAATAQALGLQRDTAIGKSLFDVVDTETASKLTAGDAEVLDGSKPRFVETVSITPADGGAPVWIYMEKHSNQLRGADEPTVITLGADISEIVGMRLETEQHLAQLELLQEEADLGYWSLDVRTKAIQWSKEVHRLHGTDPDTFVPDLETAVNFYHPDDVAAVSAIVEDAMAKGTAYSFEKRLVRQDKTVVHVKSEAVCITDSAGQTVRVVGVFKEA